MLPNISCHRVHKGIPIAEPWKGGMEREPDYCTYLYFIFSLILLALFWIFFLLFHLLSVRNLQPSFLLLLVLMLPICSWLCCHSLLCSPLLLLSCHAPPTHTIAVLLLPLALSPPLAGALLSYAPLAGTHVLLNSVAFIFSLAILAGPLTADH